MNSLISLVLNLPPSTNKLYRKVGHAMVLTTESQQYHKHVQKIVGETAYKLVGFPIDGETIYKVDIDMELSQVENAGWYEYEKSGERKAKTRYKRIDVDNRVKFVQDCVVKTLGIPDDCQIFSVSITKRKGAEDRIIFNIAVIDDPERYM
jgi:Holliday junction resolvase RusA-like endonuclease